MLSVKNQLLEIIDILPEEEQILLLNVARHFLPDDIATRDDLEAVAEALQEYENGETVSRDSINWD